MNSYRRVWPKTRNTATANRTHTPRSVPFPSDTAGCCSDSRAAMLFEILDGCACRFHLFRFSPRICLEFRRQAVGENNHGLAASGRDSKRFNELSAGKRTGAGQLPAPVVTITRTEISGASDARKPDRARPIQPTRGWRVRAQQQGSHQPKLCRS